MVKVRPQGIRKTRKIFATSETSQKIEEEEKETAKAKTKSAQTKDQTKKEKVQEKEETGQEKKKAQKKKKATQTEDPKTNQTQRNANLLRQEMEDDLQKGNQTDLQNRTKTMFRQVN